MHKVVCYATTWALVLWIGVQSAFVIACPIKPPHWTKVENKFIVSSGRQGVYQHERIAVIETRNQYELGKIAALRFIEWAQDNPNGVIALTSGNTPEFFIKFLNFYKKNWRTSKVQAELQSLSITGKYFPDTSNMKFVQLEEYFPIASNHYKNSTNYIKRHYINFFGLKKENTLLMDMANKGILAEKGLRVVFMNGKVDLSIMDHKAGSQLEWWQQQAIKEAQEFCDDYEKQIRAWGGIDFFIGSLSYGGHLGFNGPGGAVNSKTHIVKLDYRTAAHAAKDLGGIEHARGKVGITIGLGTITFKPDATIIIMAADESKAPMVRDAIEKSPDIKYPATALQKFSNARFYITAGAASLLHDRKIEDVRVKSKYGWTQKLIQDVIIEISLAEKKSILDLTNADILKHECGELLLRSPPKPLPAMLTDVRDDLIGNIENGLKISTIKAHKILHTGPYHDDIMLGYYPLMDVLSHKYQNHFSYITSGFNSVPDSYILNTITRASDRWINKEADTIFKHPYAKLVNSFRNHFVKQDIEHINMLDTTIALRHLVNVFDIKNAEQLKKNIRWLKDDYFPSKQPGDMDVSKIRLLKGMIRESEADRLWSLKNIPLQNISHLRSKFYTGKEFSKTPRMNSDIMPFLDLYNSYQPDIITVADNPQSYPSVIHYKSLQIVAQALRNKDAINKSSLQVWGYRNIWFRYRVQDSNIFVPVSERALESQRRVFKSCFNTQRSASFPSPFNDGDFSSIMTLVQREQLADLKVLLGADYFSKNNIPELKNASGFIFLNKMSLNDFFQRAEDLQQAMDLE